MKKIKRCSVPLLLTILLTHWLLISGCGPGGTQSDVGGTRPVPQPSSGSGAVFHIVSGSENKGLEPLVKQFAAQENVRIQMNYLGSVDISREIEKGTSTEFDAVWPAASLWIALGDSKSVVKHARSIMRSPVVFALKKNLVDKFQLAGKAMTVGEILQVVEQHALRFAMTSATQSNSGASWYLGCLSAFSGQPEVLASEHLADPAVQERIKRFLGAVNRSAGSSGWLNKMLLEYYGQYDGMVNYEALVIEANRELVAAGKNPLYALYPVDGLTIADSPLGYINKGDSKKETLFLKLQEYLMSEPIQTEIQKLGRRTGLVGLNPGAADKQVFNPEWGIDLERILSPIRTPSGPVVREALTLYQTAFRKPSLTAFVLDYSGSMKGTGEQQLKQAMYTLLDPDEAARFLLQPSPQDVTLVIPFSSHPIAEWKVEGNDPEDLRRLLRNIQAQAADGGTQMYEATALAFRRLQSFAESGKYHCAAIVMSDGQSQGSIQEFEQVVATENLSRDIPIYTILFGKATEAQMKPLAESTTGKMFDGRKDVVDAFRQAKGYN